MAFFSDRILNSIAAIEYTKEEALVGIVLSVSAPTGYLSEDCMISLFSFLSRRKMLQTYSQKALRKMMLKLQKDLRKYGADNLVDDSLIAMPKDLYEGIFELACDSVFLDGEGSRASVDRLFDLQAQIGMDELTARERMNMILKKSRI